MSRARRPPRRRATATAPPPPDARRRDRRPPRLLSTTSPSSSAAAAAAAALLLLTLTSSSMPAPSSALRCSYGWGGGGGVGESREVPPDRIDDGYCDCPADGADEMGTGACSGGADGGWPGVVSTAGGISDSGRFQCPQQPSLLLPPSRLGDGICDCCDGADEIASAAFASSSSCPDVCDAVLAAERAAAAKALSDYEMGSAMRRKDGREYGRMISESSARIDELKGGDVPRLEGEAEELESNIRSARLGYMYDRFGAAGAVSGSVSHLGEVATYEEVRSFIVSACHVAGEIADSSSPSGGVELKNGRTCLPLRLAGLDLGILWEDENFDDCAASVRRVGEDDDDDDDSRMEFAALLDRNSGEGAEISVGRDDGAGSGRGGDDAGRREYRDDDDLDGGGHRNDEMYPYEEDDDYPRDYPGMDAGDGDGADPPPPDATDESDEEKDGEEEEEEEKAPPTEKTRREMVREAVTSARVYASRSPFRSRARALTERIDAMLKEAEKGGGEGEGGAEAEGAESTEAAAAGGGEGEEESLPVVEVDPMAVQMVGGALSRRLRHLERGEDYATSANILLDALEAAGGGGGEGGGEDGGGAGLVKRELSDLAVGTVYHGLLGAGDVAEIFYSVLPELRNDVPSDDDETCASAHAHMCPPRTASRGGVSLPPPALVAAAEVRCGERSGAPAATCGGHGARGGGGGAGGAAGADDIPSGVPDGYYGYYPPRPRGEHDALNDVFAPYDGVKSVRGETEALEGKKGEAERRLEDARGEVRDLEEKMGIGGGGGGGRGKGKGEGGENKFGPEGELYGIRDSCHAVESGKYEYEVCVFGKATQRDKGKKKGGTNLGRWGGMTRDEETGEITLRWENGAGCWNGPKRSATVRVTCGAETRLLTADEPRTCEYEMTMESHIACDDRYRERHGL